MTWHLVEKEFRDAADDIEGVNIHYAWTPLGASPEWESARTTRYMPVVPRAEASAGEPATRPLRRKILRLPLQILDADGGHATDRYLLHHYFEIFRDGHREYSPLYTEEIVTGAGAPVAVATA